MRFGEAPPATGGLVERETELATIDAALERAAAGSGGVVLLTGVAGIGKTTLLDATRPRAAAAGLMTLSARGGEIEGEFAHGVIRQLLEAHVAAAPKPQRERLLAAAAALAIPAVVTPPGAPVKPAADPYAVIHGLYWLLANIAAEAPTALLIDDAQWADRPSLEALAYASHRLEGLAVAIIATVRTGDGSPHHQLLDELIGDPATVTLSLAPLSDRGVARMLAARLGRQPDPVFATASRTVTGGNPFLVRELALALRADAREPTAEAAAGLDEIGPATVARSTLTRVGRLSADAIALVQAIAALDHDATLARARALSELDQRRALDALDALIAADVLSGDAPIAFSHPMVRRAIYEELAPGQRSLAHLRAAERLAAEGAEPAAVATHLLRTAPLGSAQTVERLRDAAAQALSRGAPDSAVTYLERALGEGSERELRVRVVAELATARKLARHPDAADSFAELHRLSDEPATRATALLEQAGILAFTGDFPGALALLEAVPRELDDSSHPVARAAEAVWAVMTIADPRRCHEFHARAPRLRALVDDGGAASAPLAMLLAAWGAQRDEPPADVRALFELGWSDGRYLQEGENIEVLPQGIAALVILDQLDRAEEVVKTIRAAAVATGSQIAFLYATAHATWIAAARGDLLTAASELSYTLGRTQELGLLFATVAVLSYGAEALLERPDLADLASLVETVPLGAMTEVQAGSLMIEVRGRLRFAAGRREEAVADLRHVGAIARKLGYSNPGGYPGWRSTLAQMLDADARDEALALVGEELTDARRAASPRRIGIALRALGLLEPDAAAGVAHLEESVAVLLGSPARLEHARSLVELGAALRRRGQRAAARDPLREALDLAHRCGAVRLAERAQVELAATGARPRRERLTGLNALTPSELRVARLAAEGHTSREIAQLLFITIKTVDTHLGHVYTKLGVAGRAQLEGELAQA